MKISVDIDCTPEEARAFLGLPDVGPVQEQILAEITKNMAGGLGALDPNRVLQAIFPQQTGGWGDLQKAFWANMTGDKSGQDGS